MSKGKDKIRFGIFSFACLDFTTADLQHCDIHKSEVDFDQTLWCFHTETSPMSYQRTNQRW